MRTVLAGLGLGLIGVCTLSFVVLHFLDTRLDPVERTLSEYALSRVGWLFPIAVFAIGAAAVLLAVGLRWLGPPAPTAALALLVVFAVAMALTGIARTDAMDPRAGGLAMSTSGSVHATAGLIAIVALCVAAPMLTGALVQHGSARAAAEVVGWLPTFGAAVFVTTVVAREPIEWLTGRVSVHGIGERFGFGGFIIWLAYATLTMLTARTAR